MKITPLALHLPLAVLILLGTGFLSRAADEPTALEVVKEANRHVGEEVKDKVIRIRSEKSVAGLTPNIWYVMYYNPDVRFKTTEVKIGAGKKLDVRNPLRQPFAYINIDRVIDLKKVKVDSDDAIKIASAEPLLEKLTLRATELSLEPSDNGPVWKVRLWAARLRNPNRDADIGELTIDAIEGKVIKNDLRISRVD
ncbi:MAG TPA: hypothetical protein GYA07_15100 [Verrucomicrobia bacterium]|nr:hypothetical protein [Verrucomicrobiota bacterium]HOB31886.1 hypothetical protein [Verrucomicrobiota bacterium]HOP98819.1 hypothetical protein [Verrucomicrobiota bacterium]